MSAYDVSQTLRKDVATGKVTLAGTTKAVLDDSRIGPHGGQLAVNGAHNPATLDLDFANGRYHLDDGGPAEITDPASILSVTRATTKWVCGPNGKLREVPIDTLAREFDPVTGEPKGVLIEKSRTNEVLWSEDFTNAAWDKSGVTLVADAAAAPDGSVAADKLVEDATNANHSVAQTVVVNDTSLTFTVFAKAAERQFVQMISSIDGSVGRVNLDLSSEEINFGGGATGDFERLGDGWYRVIFSAPCTSGSTYQVQVRTTDTLQGYPSGYLGDGTSGIYIWGAQLEEASTPSSYIPTTDAAVTRAADGVSRALGGEWNEGEGTLYWEGVPAAIDELAQVVLGVSDGTNNNRTLIRLRGSEGDFQLISVRDGVVDSVVTYYANFIPGEVVKAALSYNAQGFIFSHSGNAVLTASTATGAVVVSTLHLSSGPGSKQYTGNTLHAECYPRALTEAELIELTS